MVLQSVFRVEFSRQTRDLECFANRWSIQWKLPTIFHGPDWSTSCAHLREWERLTSFFGAVIDVRSESLWCPNQTPRIPCEGIGPAKQAEGQSLARGWCAGSAVSVDFSAATSPIIRCALFFESSRKNTPESTTGAWPGVWSRSSLETGISQSVCPHHRLWEAWEWVEHQGYAMPHIGDCLEMVKNRHPTSPTQASCTPGHLSAVQESGDQLRDIGVEVPSWEELAAQRMSTRSQSPVNQNVVGRSLGQWRFILSIERVSFPSWCDHGGTVVSVPFTMMPPAMSHESFRSRFSFSCCDTSVLLCLSLCSLLPVWPSLQHRQPPPRTLPQKERSEERCRLAGKKELECL